MKNEKSQPGDKRRRFSLSCQQREETLLDVSFNVWIVLNEERIWRRWHRQQRPVHLLPTPVDHGLDHVGGGGHVQVLGLLLLFLLEAGPAPVGSGVHGLGALLQYALEAAVVVQSAGAGERIGRGRWPSKTGPLEGRGVGVEGLLDIAMAIQTLKRHSVAAAAAVREPLEVGRLILMLLLIRGSHISMLTTAVVLSRSDRAVAPSGVNARVLHRCVLHHEAVAARMHVALFPR